MQILHLQARVREPRRGRGRVGGDDGAHGGRIRLEEVDGALEVHLDLDLVAEAVHERSVGRVLLAPCGVQVELPLLLLSRGGIALGIGHAAQGVQIGGDALIAVLPVLDPDLILQGPDGLEPCMVVTDAHLLDEHQGSPVRIAHVADGLRNGGDGGLHRCQGASRGTQLDARDVVSQAADLPHGGGARLELSGGGLQLQIFDHVRGHLGKVAGLHQRQAVVIEGGADDGSGRTDVHVLWHRSGRVLHRCCTG